MTSNIFNQVHSQLPSFETIANSFPSTKTLSIMGVVVAALSFLSGESTPINGIAVVAMGVLGIRMAVEAGRVFARQIAVNDGIGSQNAPQPNPAQRFDLPDVAQNEPQTLNELFDSLRADESTDEIVDPPLTIRTHPMQTRSQEKLQSRQPFTTRRKDKPVWKPPGK